MTKEKNIWKHDPNRDHGDPHLHPRIENIPGLTEWFNQNYIYYINPIQNFSRKKGELSQ